MKRIVLACLLFPLLPARSYENPEDYFREKAAQWNGSLGCAKEEAENLAKQLTETDMDPAAKEIAARLSDNARKIVAATEAGISAAASANRKAIQAAEDEISALHNSNELLHLKREAACEVEQLKASAEKDPAMAQLAGKIKQSYADLVANEEAAQAIKSKGLALRREIDSFKRQLRIAELDREKRQLQSE